MKFVNIYGKVLSMNVEKSLELDVILKQVENCCDFSLGKKRVQNLKPCYDRLVIRRDNARMK